MEVYLLYHRKHTKPHTRNSDFCGTNSIDSLDYEMGTQTLLFLGVTLGNITRGSKWDGDVKLSCVSVSLFLRQLEVGLEASP